jgi:GAF domain
VTWELSPGASLADLATIELRRITDVLQVDHASLFLGDADDLEHARAVAETGLSVDEALPEYSTLLTRAVRTARAAKVERSEGPGATCAALAAPLVHDDRALGALLVVTRRANRRLGAIDSEVVREATQTLVERFLAPADRGEPRFVSERAARSLHRRR